MKERIDHSNYEAWLLDRLEGRLSPEQDRALSTFLSLNPELDPGPTELPTLERSEDRLDGTHREALKRTLPPVGIPGDAPLEDLLIAAYEGDLSAEQGAALESFLHAHPEHARHAQLLALARVSQEQISFPQRSELERALPPLGTVNAWTLDDHLVARLEGDLDSAQEAALASYLLQHPVAQQQWQLMQRTRVAPAVDVFPDRDSLKQGGRIVPLFPHWASRMAAAASVAVLLGVAAWTAWGPERVPPANVAVRPVPVVAPPTVVPAPPTGGTTSTEPATRIPQEQGPTRAHTVPLQRAPSLPTTPPVALPDAPSTELPEPLAPDLAQDPLPGPAPQDPELPLLPDTPVVLTASTDNTPVITTRDRTEGTSVMGALTRTLRARVLRQPAPDDRPLDGDDALAAADVGLRAVSGAKAGVTVERGADGDVRAFNVRLGAGLSIRSGR